MQPEDIESLKTILSEDDHFKCKISIKSTYKEIYTLIKHCLKHPGELEAFKATQFGHLLDVPTHYQHSSQLMWYFILRQVETKKINEMWMLVNGIPMRFSMTEFALITGLDCSTGLDEETLRNTSIGNRLCYKYFGGSTNIYVHDLKKK